MDTVSSKGIKGNIWSFLTCLEMVDMWSSKSAKCLEAVDTINCPSLPCFNLTFEDNVQNFLDLFIVCHFKVAFLHHH